MEWVDICLRQVSEERYASLSEMWFGWKPNRIENPCEILLPWASESYEDALEYFLWKGTVQKISWYDKRKGGWRRVNPLFEDHVNVGYIAETARKDERESGSLEVRIKPKQDQQTIELRFAEVKGGVAVFQAKFRKDYASFFRWQRAPSFGKGMDAYALWDPESNPV